MRSLRLIIVNALIALAVLAPAITSAQEPRSPYGNRPTEIVLDETTVYTPPALHIQEIKLESSPQQTPLRGTFTVRNSSAELVGDITYQLELLSPLPQAELNQIVMDAADVYDRSAGSEVLTLPPQASKSVSFTYTPPAVPAGDYRLRVQVMTSEGRILGEHELTTTLAGSTEPFSILRPGTFNIPEFADLTIAPLSGPNVTAGSSFSLRATAANEGTAALTVTPTLSVHKFAPNQPVVDTIQGAPLTLAPGQSQSFEVPVTAAQGAGVYHGVLSLVNANSQRSSTLAEYRWVVRGTGADILSARIAQLRTKQGEEIRVRVDYTGPTDAETVTKGRLKIEVIDQQGTAGEFLVPDELELNDQVVEGFAPVTLSRDLAGTPGLRVTLTDLQGTILDTYTVDLPLTAAEMTELTGSALVAATESLSKTTAIFFTIGSLLAIAIILYLLRQLKKPTFSPPTPLVILLAGLIIMGLGAAAFNANAWLYVVDSLRTDQTALCQQYQGWCTLQAKLVSVTMFQPGHQVEYLRDHIPDLSFYITFAGCQNAVDSVNITLRYDKNGAGGGWHRNLDGAPGTEWQNLMTNVPIAKQCGPELCVLDHRYRMGNPSDTFSLGSLAPGVTKTTLQLQVLSARYVSLPAHLRPTNPLTQGYGQVINTWLAIQPASNPPIIVTPRKQCEDDRDNDGDNRKDEQDPACHTNHDLRQPYVPTLDSEVDPECSDTRDNDGNNDPDQADPDCHSDGNAANINSYVPADPSETGTTTPSTQCNDGIDNDGDGRTDCGGPGPDDLGCLRIPGNRTCNPLDDDETDPAFNPGDIIETE